MKRADEFFDAYALEFNAIYGTGHGIFDRVIDQVFRRSMLQRFEKTVAGCQPVAGKTVLDIGCGPGQYGITLARRGARQVLGIDFADGMIRLARDNAGKAGVGEQCRFVLGDFAEYPFTQKFDFSIITGVMDYIADPQPFVKKVHSLTAGKAFFSFPSAAGILAWQRRVRYQKRCQLYLYRPAQIEKLFGDLGVTYTVEKISRDYFVTMQLN